MFTAHKKRVPAEASTRFSFYTLLLITNHSEQHQL
jgi:hypothetical protein